jgi:CheY-like chemotaxis protein
MADHGAPEVGYPRTVKPITNFVSNMKNRSKRPGASGSAATNKANDDRVRVLLVDNSLAFLKAEESMIGGFPTVRVVGQARSGNAAVHAARECQPDLVLMDLVMPGMDGIEATRQIKAQPNPPRVVIVTLHGEEAYGLAARKAGADGFIAKAELFKALPVALQLDFTAKSRGKIHHQPNPPSHES